MSVFIYYKVVYFKICLIHTNVKKQKIKLTVPIFYDLFFKIMNEDKEKFQKYVYDLQMKELKENRPKYAIKIKIQEEIKAVLRNLIKSTPIDTNDLYIKEDEIKGLKPCELYSHYKKAGGISEQTFFCFNLSEACSCIKFKKDGYGYKRTNIYVYDSEGEVNFTKIKYFTGKIKEINNSIKELFKIDDNNKFLFRHLSIRQENLQKDTRKEIDDQNIKIQNLTKRIYDLEERLNSSK
jgi:hypothetical protein